MATVLTAILRVRDWPALRRFSDGTLIVHARAAHAWRYRLYRNAHDAAEALLIVEAASLADLLPVRDALMRHESPTVLDLAASRWAEPAEGRLWEPANCNAIE